MSMGSCAIDPRMIDSTGQRLKKLIAPVHEGFIVLGDHKLRPYRLSPGCQASYLGLWSFCVGAEWWIVIKEVSCCSFCLPRHWFWSSGTGSLGSKDVRIILNVPSLPLPWSEWNLVITSTYFTLSCSKETVSLQTAEFGSPSHLSRAWFWLVTMPRFMQSFIFWEGKQRHSSP